jgi:hypothetical protein
MSIPSVVGIPAEMKLGDVDFSLPPDARSYSVKVMASNVQSVASPVINCAGATAGILPQPQFVAQNIFFDLPCGQSPSTFLDTRFSTISFKATMTVPTAFTGAGANPLAYLRSGGYSFFDRMYITGGNGQILEDVAEVGLVYDLLTSLQLNSATRDTLALQYGFASAAGSDLCQGHPWNVMNGATLTAATAVETHSYSFPLISALTGMGSDKFLNIGRLNKLQVALQTATELPISINFAAAVTTGSFQITLSDIALNLEYVDIGSSSLGMLDSTLVDGKAYMHGTTYRTSAVSMTNVAGNQSLLAGIRGSSVKSLFARFVDGGVVVGPPYVPSSPNGKYDSKNPNANSLNFNIGGLKYPNNPVNPLISPASSFRNLQMAIGAFNNAQFQSAITPVAYCKLAAGGTASGTTLGGTQDANYTLVAGTTVSAVSQQCQFLYGENLEIVAKRGLMSGISCVNAPVFLEVNCSTAPTYGQQVYVHAMIDSVFIHDVRTGEIQVRM